MQTHQLTPHPLFSPQCVRSVEAKLGIVGHWLQLRWRVEGSAKVVLPPFTGRQRRDELWRTTCFELFVKPTNGQAYAEFNFAPSEAWAAYDFTSWREGASERAISHDPVITPRAGRDLLIMDVAIPLSDLPGPASLRPDISMTAVIEEEGGHISYWAMAHGDPGKPDFHDPACFAAKLAPPEAP
ncbi:DOMON-like domain-containing protein [Alteraurantiacibacter aestuarii]|uniref:DOMON-like domain-containing protein n=1 Tax=Alteraurantiacibacter aestuarii TaxID=650004 RepID=UPI0031DA9443